MVCSLPAGNAGEPSQCFPDASRGRRLIDSITRDRFEHQKRVKILCLDLAGLSGNPALCKPTSVNGMGGKQF